MELRPTPLSPEAAGPVAWKPVELRPTPLPVLGLWRLRAVAAPEERPNEYSRRGELGVNRQAARSENSRRCHALSKRLVENALTENCSESKRTIE